MSDTPLLFILPVHIKLLKIDCYIFTLPRMVSLVAWVSAFAGTFVIRKWRWLIGKPDVISSFIPALLLPASAKIITNCCIEAELWTAR